jgi:DNA-binding MarR family transcriptional regulator
MPDTDQAAKKVKPADAGGTLMALTKLLNGLAAHSVFEGGEIGLNEWLFLKALKDDPALKTGAFSHKLGLTAQRGTQIAVALRKAGLVRATEQAADPRKKDLSLTDKGEKLFRKIDQAVTQSFAAIVAKQPKALTMVRNFARAAIKEAQPPKKA